MNKWLISLLTIMLILLITKTSITGFSVASINNYSLSNPSLSFDELIINGVKISVSTISKPLINDSTPLMINSNSITIREVIINGVTVWSGSNKWLTTVWFKPTYSGNYLVLIKYGDDIINDAQFTLRINPLSNCLINGSFIVNNKLVSDELLINNDNINVSLTIKSLIPYRINSVIGVLSNNNDYLIGEAVINQQVPPLISVVRNESLIIPSFINGEYNFTGYLYANNCVSVKHAQIIIQK